MATQQERVQALMDALRNETVSAANITKNIDAFIYNADQSEITERYSKLKADLTTPEKRDYFLYKMNKSRKDAVEKALIDAQEIINKAATDAVRAGAD